MSDYIIRATAANNQIRAFAAVTNEMAETSRKSHNTSPIATAALGRLLTAGAMMGAMMKGEKDILTLQVNGDSEMRGMTVTADANANVKGYAFNPDVMLPASPQGKLDVGKAVGKGTLRIIKDMGMKEPYTINMIIANIFILFVNTVIHLCLDTIPTESLMFLMVEFRIIVRIFKEKLII